jgi:hypothetical protein
MLLEQSDKPAAGGQRAELLKQGTPPISTSWRWTKPDDQARRHHNPGKPKL